MKKKNQRTIFGQGPCQAYLRHAHIVLFGERFDTGAFERKAGRGVMVMSFRGERQGGVGDAHRPTISWLLGCFR